MNILQNLTNWMVQHKFVDVPSEQASLAVRQATGNEKLRKLPPTPPPQVYSQVAIAVSKFSIRQQQELMLWLYANNFVTRDLVRMIVDTVVGQGFGVQFKSDTPTIKRIVTNYQKLNKLNDRKELKSIVRQYLNTGETLFLTAPYYDTWYTVRCPSLLIRQTLLDPMNPMETIGVLLEPDYFDGEWFFYKTICKETRLSEIAKQIRKQWPHFCYYFPNPELDETIDAEGWQFVPSPKNIPQKYLEWMTKQRRGTPFFNCWSDLFNQLVDTLWAMLDKTKSWGTFNWHFQVDTQEPEFTESVKKVKLWQDSIGTPEMNSAVYTDEKVTVNPLSFPMQSTDIQKIMDLMLQFSGMSGNVPMYDLGSTQHTPYATARAQGTPKDIMFQSVQTDTEEMLSAQYQHVLTDADRQGKIPKREKEVLQNE